MQKDTVKYVSNKTFTGTALVIIFITFFVYLPTINNGFVNWDDIDYVYENVHIRSFNIDTITWAFSSTVVGNWNPLTLLSYAFDYGLWGGEAWGFHLTNLVLHAFNAIFVFVLAVLLFEMKNGNEGAISRAGVIAGFFAALLFALHPLRTESVAWVSARKDVLSGFFFLLSAISYLFYLKSGKNNKKTFFVSLCLFILALLSKPTVIMLPVVLVILDWLLLKSFELKKSVIEKIPYFVFCVISGLITTFAIYGDVKVVTSVQAGIPERLLTAAYAYSFYLYKTVLPYGLSSMYPLSMESMPSIEFFGGFVLLCVIIFFSVKNVKKEKAYTAAVLYFLAMLLPVVGILKFGRQPVADRFTYLPLLSAALLAGVFIAAETVNRVTYKIKIFIGVAACIILAILTVFQIRVWKDSITLWSRQIELFPERSAVAYNNRGGAYFVKGDYAAAIRDYDMAIKIDEAGLDSYYNRGYAKYYANDYIGAFEDFLKYTKYEKTDAGIFLKMGIKFNETKDFLRAITMLKASARLNPDINGVYSELRRAYEGLGDKAKAAEIRKIEENLR